jgi:hypothetical protein
VCSPRVSFSLAVFRREEQTGRRKARLRMKRTAQPTGRGSGRSVCWRQAHPYSSLRRRRFPPHHLPSSGRASFAVALPGTGVHVVVGFVARLRGLDARLVSTPPGWSARCPSSTAYSASMLASVSFRSQPHPPTSPPYCTKYGQKAHRGADLIIDLRRSIMRSTFSHAELAKKRAMRSRW